MIKGVPNTRDAVPLLGALKSGSAQPTDWSADGRFVLYEEQSPKTSFDMRYVALAGDRRPVTIVGRRSPNARAVCLRTGSTSPTPRTNPDGAK